MDGARCRIGRAALGLTEDELADLAGVPAADIRDLESGAAPAEGARSTIAERLAEALLRAGVSFHLDPRGRAMMRVATLDGIIEAPADL